MKDFGTLGIIAAVAATFLGHAAFGAELGMKAPELQVQEWAKGEPMTLRAVQESKKVAVVEFWATWCPPCRASIPHLTALQKKYQDNVVFFGVSAEAPETVKSFVEKQAENMDYRVIVDKDRATTSAYMEAFGIDGIPYAFLVDQKGQIVYHAHPMDPAFENCLAKVVAGDFDIANARKALAKEQERKRLFDEYGELVMDGKDQAKAKKVGQKLFEVLADDASQLGQLAWAIASSPELGFQDLDFALQCAKKAMELSQEKDADLLDTYARVLFEKGDKEQAVTYAEKALQLAEKPDMKEHIQSQIRMYKGEPDPQDDVEGSDEAVPPPADKSGQ